MRRLMLAALMLLGIAGVAFAQSSANQSVTIDGTVIQAIKLTVNTATLSLGNMVAGTTPTPISAASSPIMFTLTGNGSSVVSVTFSSVTLAGGPGSSPITFTPAVVADSVSANQATAATITSGSTVTLSGNNYSSASYYFWLGGSVGLLPNTQTPGAYSGTFTLQVAYN